MPKKRKRKLKEIILFILAGIGIFAGVIGIILLLYKILTGG